MKSYSQTHPLIGGNCVAQSQQFLSIHTGTAMILNSPYLFGKNNTRLNHGSCKFRRAYPSSPPLGNAK